MAGKRKSSKKNSTPTIYASGAVLYRKNSLGNTEIALIHRAFYDDWSLPKGKLDPGETILEAAWRELKEETGYDIVVRGYLRKITYNVDASSSTKKTDHRDHKNSSSGKTIRKNVYYWAAEVVGGEFIPNEEVDRLIWVSPEQAHDKLTYSLDQAVLNEFDNFPTDSTTVALIRHARAGVRIDNVDEDKLRTLDKNGVLQSQALAKWLHTLQPSILYSADKVRCVSTIEPFAVQTGMPLHINSCLSDEYCNESAVEALKFLKKITHHSVEDNGCIAICSQGDFIPQVMKLWGEESGFVDFTPRSRKGSLWLLTIVQGTIIRAHYLPDPLAHPIV